MGKNKNKKGKGIEKTLEKELKKSEKKMRKELSESGHDDIKSIISQLELASSNVKVESETKCDPPSPRCNVSFNAHPDKDILIMFGGEFCNGKETTVYNNLYYYHIKTGEWSQLIISNAPTPRCSHQAVTVPQSQGQLWLFGGEYVTKNQSQFFHYNDLWVLHLAKKKWEKIIAPGAPSARSGHRMVVCRKMLFIIGGFQDNTVAYRYFNDVHAFSLESHTWLKLQISGLPPSPRSGCVMAVTQDQCHIMLYGGYSKQKVKKDVDKGCVHSDMFMLSLIGENSKTDQKCLSWKWSSIKQFGHIPSPRCSTSLCVTSSNRAVLFGGIRDDEEDEESVEGSCLDDMYLLEIDKGKWHPLTLKKPTDPSDRKKRRRKDKSAKNKEENSNDDDGDEDSDDGGEIGPIHGDVGNDLDLDKNVKKLRILQPDVTCQPENINSTHMPIINQPDATLSDDAFTLVVNKPQTSQQQVDSPSNSAMDNPITPSPRMRPMLAAKRGILYLYGGVCEQGNKQITLNDFYSIDLQRMNEWDVILKPQDASMDWQESSDEESSDDDDDDDEEESSEDDESTENEDDDDDGNGDEDDPTKSGPRKKADENFEKYFERTSLTWKKKALKVAEKENIKASNKQIDKAALKMASEYWERISF